MAGMKVAFQFVADAVGLIGGVRVAREELDKLGATAATTGANLRQTSNKDGVAGLDAQRQAATGTAQALNRLGDAANDSGAALRKVATGDEAAGLTAQGKAANGLANDLGLVSARSAALTAAHGAGATAARAQSDALQSYGRQASTANDNTLTLSSAIGALKSGFSLLGGLLGVEALRQFAGEALETRKGLELLDVRLKSLIGTSGDYAETQNFLATSANRLSVDQKTLTNTYAQLLDLKKADLVTTGQARTLLEGFVNIQKATGASTDELKLSMVGMAQGFSAGVLHAEELAQVTEPLPGLLQALDRAAGTTSGGFRRMVNDGKVTSSMFRDVLIKAMQDYAGAAEKAANTIDAAETRRRNAQERLKNEAGRQIAPHYIAANDKATSVFDWTTSFLQDNSRQNDFNKLVRLYKDRRAANYQLENASGAADTARWTEKLERLNALILETERSLTQLGGATEDTRRGMAELWKEADSGVKITGDQIAAFTEAAKAAGYSYEKGKLLTTSQSELGQAVSAVNALLGKSPDALKAMGLDATSLTQVLDHLREKLDPVTAAIVQLKREAETLSVGPKYRDLYQTLDKAEQDKGKPLTADESADLTAGWRSKKTAEANDQIRALGEQVKAERDYQQAVASGNVVQIARAEAKKKVADAVANGFPAAQKDKLLEQETALALERVSGAAGAAATDLGAATTATMRLAMAAGAGEAAQRAATYANKEAEATLKGNIALSAVRAANAQDEAAAILTIRNETVRGLALETANTNALTTAMAAGGEAVRTAQENEYKLGLIRKLGTDATVAGTAAQKALNDAMDAYRANRAANDNSALEKERLAANDNLALAQREIDLMGEAEPLRSRALTSLQNQQEAARKVAELGEAGAKQWLAWQEQIADKRAYVDFLKSVQATAKEISKDVSEALYDRLMDPSKATSVVDVFKAIFKRIAVAALETQIVLPIVTQVVGSMPGLFGIQAPASVGGQAATGGGLTGSLTNTALSKAGGWALDKLAPGGLTSGLDAWGYSTLGIGSASYGTPLVATNGMLTGGGATSLATPTGVTGGLSGYFGAASAGAFGGALGAMIGTATNSKVVGGLSGAALGAGGSALASAMGLGAVGGPVGIAVGAIVGGIMGMLGTQKKTVGPNGAGNLLIASSGLKSGSADGDNGMDGSAMLSVSDAVSQSINTIVAGIGAKFAKTTEGAFAHFTMFQEGNKWAFSDQAGGGRQEFTSQEAFVNALIKTSLQRLDGDGRISGVNADVRTALGNTKATKAEDLANDLSFASGFRKQLDALNASMNPVSNQIKTMTDAAKALGEQVKTSITDWRDKAAELGLATDAELTAAARRGIEALMGLGPAVEPLTGLSAVTKQAEINFETLRPSLAALGYSAAEVADLSARYSQKMEADYTASVRLLQRQGATSLSALVDPSAKLSLSDRFSGMGLDPASSGVAALIAQFQAVEAAAGTGALTFGQLQAALGKLDAAAMAGIVSGDQYTSLVGSLTAAWQTATGVLTAQRQGLTAIETAMDAGWRANLDGRLSDAGLSGGAIEALRSSFQPVLDAAKTGSTSAAQMRGALSALDAQLRAGAVTAEQHRAAVAVLTGAWSDSANAAQAAAEATQTAREALRAQTEAAEDLATRALRAQGQGVEADAMDLRLRQEREYAQAVTSGYSAANLAQLAYVQGLERQTAATQAAAQAAEAQAQQVASSWSNLLSTAIQQVTAGYQTTATDARQAATAWSGVADAMDRARRDVLLDSQYSNLRPEGLRDGAKAEFERLQTLVSTYADAVKAGSATAEQRQAALDAAGQLTDAGKKYLENQRAFSGDGTAYDQSLTDVRAAWEQSRQLGLTLQSGETARADQADAQIARLEQLTGLGSAQRALLDQIKAAISSGNSDMSQLVALVRQTPGYARYSAPADVQAAWNGLSGDARQAVARSVGFSGAYSDAAFNDYAVANGLTGRVESIVRGWTGAQSNPYGATATAQRAWDAMSDAERLGVLGRFGWTTGTDWRQANAFLVASGQANAFDAALVATGRGYQTGGVIGQTPGGVVGNGRVGIDSVTAEYAGGGKIWLAGREGVLTAQATDAIGGERAIAWINRHNALPNPLANPLARAPANDRVVGAFQRGGVVGGAALAAAWSGGWGVAVPPSPSSAGATVDLAPVVVAVSGVRSAVLEIGGVIRDMAARLANVEDAIDRLAAEQRALGVKILKVATR